jgi:hypothetical protein
MTQTRAALAQHALNQQKLYSDHQTNLKLKTAQKIVGKLHHLVSTKCIPGVMANVTQTRLGDIDKYLTRYERGGQTAVVIPSFAAFPETELRNNDGLREWMKKTVGGKEVGKTERVLDYDEALHGEKFAQGPFLVWWFLVDWFF